MASSKDNVTKNKNHSHLKIHQPHEEDSRFGPLFMFCEYGVIESDYTKGNRDFTPTYKGEKHQNPQEFHRQGGIIKKEAGWRCRVCNSQYGIECHHRTYERWGNEDLDDLTCLCTNCHEIFHRHRRLAA